MLDYLNSPHNQWFYKFTFEHCIIFRLLFKILFSFLVFTLYCPHYSAVVLGFFFDFNFVFIPDFEYNASWIFYRTICFSAENRTNSIERIRLALKSTHVNNNVNFLLFTLIPNTFRVLKTLLIIQILYFLKYNILYFLK